MKRPNLVTLVVMALLLAAPVQMALAQSAGVTLTALTPSTVPEGGSATYTVVLDTAPSSAVTIAVANRGQSADDSDLTVSPPQLTFTTTSWNTPHTVTVTAAQDSDTADGSAVIIHTATSTDSTYNGVTIANVTATEDDDDTVGVTLSTTSLTVPEGGSATYAVRLATLPSATVFIDLAKQAGGDGNLTVSPPQLTFTTKGWDLPQQVTVSAAQDTDAAEGTAVITHTATSSDSTYGGITIANVTATEDDDELGVTLSKKSVRVPEGGSATYTVVLDGPPTASVTIAVAKQSGGDGNLTVAPASLTFTTFNYNTAQTVTVSATQDNDETNGTATITHTATSTDSDFNGLAIASVSATEADDDTPGVTLSKTSVSVPEGSTATYTVVLDTTPTHAVTIAVAKQSGGDADLTVAPASLTFSTTTWSTAQTVTVSATEDDSDDTDGTATITHTATSTDPDYGGITIASVTATEADNDTLAGVTLSKTSLTVTEGGSATYAVVLNTAPSANVTVAVANRGQSSDDSDLTVAPASLSFSTTDWSTAQTVTVSAKQDADTADGSAVITHTATSSDASYGGITIASVTATEADDDSAPVSADVTLAVSRDNRTAIPLASLPFSDADGGSLHGVKIVTLPGASAGTLGLVKTGIYAGAATVLCVGTIDAIVAGQEVLDAVSSVLYFCPQDGFTSTTFEFQVIDSQGRSSAQTYTATLVGPPGQVTGLEAEVGNGYVRLSWTDPKNPAITGYEYRQKSGANDYGAWTAMTGTSATTTRYSVSSLTNATAYTFQVRAKSKGGAGPIPSAAVTATPTSAGSAGKPAQPTGLWVLHAGGSGSWANVRLLWDDPEDPSITRYEAQREYQASPSWIKPINWANSQIPDSGPTTTSVEFQAGSHENRYKFRVRAVNAAGAGPWAVSSVFQLDFDAATAVLTALTPGNGRVRLNWTHSGPLQLHNGRYWGYQTNNGSDTTISGNQNLRSYVVSGLTNGSTYTYEVFTYGAPNADGSAGRRKRYSNARTITLPAAPAKPTGLTVKPASAGASLSWTDPNNDAVTGWQYQQKLSSETWGLTHPWTRVPGSNAGTTSVSVSGLTDGTAYTFRVRALIEYEQALGGDLASTASDDVSVTPVGVVVSKDRLALTEGGTAGTYTVKLTQAPTANVTITVSVDSDGSVTADTDPNTTGNQTTLTFTSTDYDAKTVKVTAAEDGDGRHSTATIAHTVSSTDPRYGNLASLPGLTAAVTDNDALGITLSRASATVPEGSTATYTVKLATQPVADVTVTITKATGDDGNLTVDTDPNTAGNQNTLTFTTTTWNTAQTVKVAAGEDNDDDNGTATFTHTATNGGYGGVTATLTATEADNERGITLSKASVSVPEGSTATYTVKLATQPAADVTVTITKATGDDGNLTVDTDPNTAGNQNTLTFTTTTWNTAQTVKVAAGEDNDDDNGTATFTHTATNGGYGGVTATLTATEADNERGIVLTPSTGVTVPEGGTVDYTVKLATQPVADVTVTITKATGDDANLTVDTDPNTTGNQDTLTFTTTTWNTAQTVKVAAGEDNDDDNGTATFTHTATNGGYGGVTATLTATEADNERGIVLTPSTGVTVPEGGTVDYTVKLATQPVADVTVTITKATGDDGNLTVDTDPNTAGNQNTLTFTTTTWNTAQTVKVAAGEDNDDDNGTATFTHTATNGGYGGVTATLTATEADNERGIVLTPSTGVTVPEGGTVDYTVKLATQPVADVTVTITKATGDDGNLTVDTDPNTTGNQDTLTFTTTTWNTAQTVKVAAGEDNDDDNGTATFTHTATNGGYGGVTATLTATEADNERGISLSTSTVTMPEGGTATYTVMLNTQPSSAVTVTVAGTSGTDLTVDTDPNTTGNQSTLTFTTSTWNTAQTVTVTAGPDNDDDNDTATLTHTATGGGYGGVARSLTVTVVDGDRGITLSAASVTVPEGGEATYTVVLDSQPSADVTVRIGRNSGGDPDLTVDTDPNTTGNQNTLTFTTTTWNTAQTVKVSADEDNDALNGTADFGHFASGGGYDNVTQVALTATEADNERGIVLSQARFSLPEGKTWDYTVKLASQPDSDVTVAIAGNAGGDGDLTVNKSSLTFTTGNWNTLQTVTVSAKEDDDALNGTATFTHTATGGGYAGVTASLTVTEEDNERGLELSASSLSVPEGSFAKYTVRLASEPIGMVTVTITKIAISDPDLKVDTDLNTTGNQTTLTFTRDNWKDEQSVTVTAAEDDGDGFDGTARFGHVATGGGYRGVDAMLTATEADDDRDVVLSPSRVTVPEGGTTTYAVKLSAQPTGTVTVTIAKDTGGDQHLTANPSTLTFTRNNWNRAQTVTVAAAEENSDDYANGTATFTHTASDGGYGGVSATLTATEADNDRVLGIPATLRVTEGETATYDVKLAEQPTATVTLTLAISGDDDLTVDTDANTDGNQSTLTFGTSTWDTAQTVTVAAARDEDDVNGSAVITTTAASSDAGYHGIPVPGVTVSEEDTSGAPGSTPPDTPRVPRAVGVTLSASQVSVPEGGAASYTAVLASQPTAAVTIAIANRGSDGDDPDLTVVDTDPDTPGEQSTLTFTTTTWSTPRRVTLAAVHDADGVDGTAVFTHTATSDDAGYHAIAIADVTATEGDDDRRIVLSPSRVTVAEGTAARYTVKLAAQPSGEVTVTVAKEAGGDPDLTVDTDADTAGEQNTLTFTPEDWSTARTVTVAAVEDADGLDGTARFTHAGTGGGYGGVSATLTATEDDDERRMIELSSSRVTVAEGTAARYTVKLAAQPSGEVTVTVAKEAGGDPDLTVDTDADTAGEQNTLTFTPEDWSTARTVTVAAAEDADGLDGTARFTHAGTGGGYGGVSATLTATEDDDERRMIELSSSRVTVAEGTAARYTVKLAAQPSGEVTVTVAKEAGGDPDLTVDTDADTAGEQNTLTFTPEDWSTARTVTVAAAEDADGLDGTARFTHAGTGGGYGGVSATLTATEDDDERRMIELSSSRVTVAEGTAARYTVKLAAQPSGEVTVTVAKEAGGDPDLTVDTDADTAGEQNTLTFTPEDWSTARTVTVAAAEDADGLDGTARFTHAGTGGGYGGVSATLTATEDDDERRMIELSSSRVTVAEGTAARYTVKLAAQPSGEVTVTVAKEAGGDPDLTVDTDADTAGEQNTLTFTPEDWSTARTVTVAAAEDADGLDGTARFTHAGTGGGYGGVSATLTATEDDDERRMIELSSSRVTVAEGTAARYTVKLAAQPSGEVTVTVAKEAGGDPDLTVDTDADTAGEQNTLTFTPEDWSTARTVTVAAAEDADGLDGTARFTHAGTGGGYGGVSATLTATEDDDERRMIELSSSRVTVAEGTAARYTVKLAAQPSGEVTVTVAKEAGGDPDLTVDTDADTAGEQNTLTFTPEDWSTARTVTVAAAEDADGLDGTARFTHAGTGGGYDGVSATLTATEDDDYGIDVTLAVAPEEVAENGGAQQMTVTARVSGGPFATTRTVAATVGVAGDSAEVGVDYEPVADFTITIPAGEAQATQQFMLVPIDDTELDEDREITITGAFGDVPVAPATVRLLDDDTEAARRRVERVNDRILPELSRAWTESALEVALGCVAGPRAADDGGLAVVAGALHANAAAVNGGGMSLAEALAGTTLAVPVASSEAEATGLVQRVSVWGEADYRWMEDADGAVRWDGEMVAAHAGVDVRLDHRYTAGVGLSWSEGTAAYTDRSGELAAEGSYRSRLAGLHPYLCWNAADGSNAWATVGLGAGVIELDDGMAGKHESGAWAATAAAGGSVRLLSGAGLRAVGAAALDLRGDAWLTRHEVSADGHLIGRAEVITHRVRLALAGTQAFALGGWAALTPEAELGVRWDGGPGASGLGVELGGAMRLAAPAWRLTGEVRGRALLVHERAQQEWGVSGRLRLGPGQSGAGLAMSVQPAYGAAAGGGERLWTEGVAALGAVDEPGESLSAEIGYGLAVLGGVALVTPYGGLDLSGGERRYRVGGRLTVGGGLDLELEGRRRERADAAHGAALHEAALSGSLRW